MKEIESDRAILRKITLIVEKWNEKRIPGTEFDALYDIYRVLDDSGIL